MKQVSIRRVNNKLYIQDYVGVTNVVDGIQIKIIYYDSTYEELTIEIDRYKNGLYRCQEKISMAFGEDILIDKLRTYFYIDTIIDDGIEWSVDTINMFDNLIKINCTNFTISNEDTDVIYTTDDNNTYMMPCMFLSPEEKNFLRKTILKKRTFSKDNNLNSIKISSLIK